MEGIRRAGCDAHLHERILGVMRNTRDYVQKLRLFSEYLQRIMRQHISSVLNNDLRSNHALYTVKYLEQGKFHVCRDLRHLIRQIAPGLHSFMREDKQQRPSSLGSRSRQQQQQQKQAPPTIKEEAYAQVSLAIYLWHYSHAVAHTDFVLQEAASPSYWQLNSPSTFLTYSWLMDDLLREHNERFFYLTPQNLRITNDVWVATVQFRLGQHEVSAYGHSSVFEGNQRR